MTVFAFFLRQYININGRLSRKENAFMDFLSIAILVCDEEDSITWTISKKT